MFPKESVIKKSKLTEALLIAVAVNDTLKNNQQQFNEIPDVWNRAVQIMKASCHRGHVYLLELDKLWLIWQEPSQYSVSQ